MATKECKKYSVVYNTELNKYILVENGTGSSKTMFTIEEKRLNGAPKLVKFE